MVCSFSPFKDIHQAITIQCWSSVTCSQCFSIHSMSSPAGSYWPLNVSLCDMLQSNVPKIIKKKKERKKEKERKKSLFKGWSVQLSHSFMSNSLLSHEPQQARPPCPSASPKPMSIESVMPSIHLILWSPLLLLPSIVSSNKMLSNEPALHIRWPKYWSFSFKISPSNEH